ncbi:hypothetical protein RRG08_015309 [Elysia crispata]|uniref:Uncharacterized protein n=1 Tax=Elysia crispata TaxID=231223 RepID=A0AAE0ZTR1_9GAST|nr:hypothetical protein RRG08_015309 [Elysia crispata]
MFGSERGKLSKLSGINFPGQELAFMFLLHVTGANHGTCHRVSKPQCLAEVVSLVDISRGTLWLASGYVVSENLVYRNLSGCTGSIIFSSPSSPPDPRSCVNSASQYSALTLMESLIDCLDTSKWEEISPANKPDGFVEFHVNPHGHKQLDKTTFCYMVESDDVSASVVVKVEHTIKDPIKKVSVIELRLSGDKVTGIDLDGDIVVLKS